jgi:hypothetical protein
MMMALVVITDVQQQQETSQFKLSPLRLCSSNNNTFPEKTKFQKGGHQTSDDEQNEK